MKFHDLGLSEPLLRAVGEKGYDTPTPIQQQAIPPVLAGRDLQGCAQTGTGKTAAFTLPILQLLAAEPAPRGRREIRALVLTPTRELAIQIDDCCRDYARHLPLRHTVIFGGVNQRPQVEALQRGVDLLVATPGRLLDLIGQGYITLRHLRFFVLDEADRMLDMGFIHDIRRILPLLPEQRQTLFFSATMPDDIARLAAGMLHDPVRVAVTPPASVVETIAQRVHFAEKADKSQLLIRLLSETDAEQVLVFSRTKHGADRLARVLNKAGIEARAIHGDKSQNARVKAMDDFRSGRCRVLIATDIAARGIDIDQLPLVINYELPEVPETYVHRIGRTGRAGHEGAAWSFCSEAEYEYLTAIRKLTGAEIRIEGPVPEYAARAEARAAERRPASKPKQARTSGRQSASQRTSEPQADTPQRPTPEPTRSSAPQPEASAEPTARRRRGRRRKPAEAAAQGSEAPRTPEPDRTADRSGQPSSAPKRTPNADRAGKRPTRHAASETPTPQTGGNPEGRRTTAGANPKSSGRSNATANANPKSSGRNNATANASPKTSGRGAKKPSAQASGSTPKGPERHTQNATGRNAQASARAHAANSDPKTSARRTKNRPAKPVAAPAAEPPRKPWWKRWL